MRFIVFTPSLISVLDNATVTTRNYDLASLDLNAELNRVDAVLVQGWESPQLIAAMGRHRVGSGNYWLFFQDTNERLKTPTAAAAHELRFYDGVLVSNDFIRQEYSRHRWIRRVLTMPQTLEQDFQGTVKMCAELLALTEKSHIGQVA